MCSVGSFPPVVKVSASVCTDLLEELDKEQTDKHTSHYFDRRVQLRIEIQPSNC